MTRPPKNNGGSKISPVVSKTALKKQMQELQSMGERLLGLPAARLALVPMPDDLQEAIMLGRQMTKFGALNRQKQYIGKIMRQIDPEPVRQALAAFDREGVADKQVHKLTEQWRERLLDEGDTALQSFLEHYPATDSQRLRQIMRKYGKASARVVLSTEKRKLYRFLHEILKNATPENE
jgi:ribosome-associated protein